MSSDHDKARRRFLNISGTACAVLTLTQLNVAQAGLKKIKLRELYNKDFSFSTLATNMQSERIAVQGYMAPPLKAVSSFFVLTRRPMATCPFCNDGDDWPDDIIAVYTKRVVDIQPFNAGIVVEGRLELGDYKDPDTGFFSRVRLVNAIYKRT